jgi:hypothetical protein
MSIVAAIRYENKIFIGSDSIVLEEETSKKFVTTQPKVFELDNGLVIGFVGPWRLGQVLRYGIVSPSNEISISSLKLPKDRHENFEFMVKKFVPQLIQVLEAANITSLEGALPEFEGSILVAWKNNLFLIDSIFQVFEIEDFYTAIGGADDISIGSLATFFEMNLASLPEPVLVDDEETLYKNALMTALCISEKYYASVQSPFTIIST